MANLPLYLMANAKGWGQFLRRRSDPNFAPISEQVQKRDNHTCQFCGFRAHKFQEIVSLNHDYFDNNLDNLVTSCILCMQCQFLGTESVGKVVYMPEFTQAQINHICRVLFCIIVANADKPEASQAKALYRSLRNRVQGVEEFFGEDTSDSAIFGQCLLDAKQVPLSQQQAALQHLRLLPMRGRIPKQIQYWTRIVLVKFDTMRVALERSMYG